MKKHHNYVKAPIIFLKDYRRRKNRAPRAFATALEQKWGHSPVQTWNAGTIDARKYATQQRGQQKKGRMVPFFCFHTAQRSARRRRCPGVARVVTGAATGSPVKEAADRPLNAP